MRKTFKVTLVLFFLFNPFVFSASKEIDMISMFPQTRIVYPQNAEFINIIDPSTDNDIYNFKLNLNKEFNISWTDENFDIESRKKLANSLSSILSSLLPCEDVLFSYPIVLSGGEKSFRFKDVGKNQVYSVILRNGKILSITKF